MSTSQTKRIRELEEEIKVLRRTIELQKRQMQFGGASEEMRALRAKIAEWEGSTVLMNGGYWHGSRFIRPWIDLAEE